MADGDEELVRVGRYLDSGATDHMLCDSRYFSMLRRLERSVEIIVANGQRLLAEYCGDVLMYTVVGDNVRKCEVENVLYLPGLSCNLVSVKRIAKAGLQVCFEEDKAEV